MDYKNFQILTTSYALKFIKPIGRGSIHKSLRGHYTSDVQAMKAIDRHLILKGEDDAKTSSSG